jgi:hypothetical protein
MEIAETMGASGRQRGGGRGYGGAFMQVVHCVALGNDGLVYVCDRQSDRIQVFDKTGHFRKNLDQERAQSSRVLGHHLVDRIFFGPRTEVHGRGRWGRRAVEDS